jgi:hypothetical protein
MAATVRDGEAAARVEMDDHDDGGAASDGEMDMDMDVEADSELQHGRDAAGRANDGDGDDEYALVSNHVPFLRTAAAATVAGRRAGCFP